MTCSILLEYVFRTSSSIHRTPLSALVTVSSTRNNSYQLSVFLSRCRVCLDLICPNPFGKPHMIPSDTNRWSAGVLFSGGSADVSSQIWKYEWGRAPVRHALGESVCLSVYMSVCLSLSLFIYLSVCLSVCLAGWLAGWLAASLSLSLSLSVCLPRLPTLSAYQCLLFFTGCQVQSFCFLAFLLWSAGFRTARGCHSTYCHGSTYDNNT